MTGAPLVVLDACVLANFSLCDTLLRLAEAPRLFEPKWSEEILREAWISGYEPLVLRMTNDEKDRHVAAAAVHGGASTLLTFNLRQTFLSEIFRREQAVVLSKLATSHRPGPKLETVTRDFEDYCARVCCRRLRLDLDRRTAPWPVRIKGE